MTTGTGESEQKLIALKNIDETERYQATDAKATHAERTNRLLAWGQILKSIAPIIWAIVILVVIIPLIGQIFISRAFPPEKPNHDSSGEVVVVKPLDWSKVNEAVKLTFGNARNSAEAYASKELDAWVDELVDRVDSSFLDWYFGYFNQKQIEYKSLFVQLSSGAVHFIDPSSPTPATKVAEAITEDFQVEFAKRVLRPQISQLRLERLTQQTVKHYLDELRGNISNIAINYQIPQADWNHYLRDVAVSINDTEGQVSNLSLKVLTGGGAYLAVKPVVAPLVLKIGSKVVAKLASKAGGKIAIKSGSVLTGKVASAVLDCTVGVGIILWDVWDTNHTASVEKPILRNNLVDYLTEVKFSLLNNPQNGIMTVIGQIESLIVPNLDRVTKSQNEL